MTIRYKCEECGSVLKIKDELAGTAGRCPKCKQEFTVPAAPPAESPATAESPPSGEASATDAAPAADDADFDPVAFLMEGPEKASPPGAAPAKAPQPAATGQTAVAGDEPPPAPRRQRSRPATAASSAAESAGAMLGGTASTNAKQLLTRSMEESRVRAAEMPVDEEEPGVDYSDFWKLVGTRIAPGVAGLIVVCAGLYWLTYSALSDYDLPDLGKVSGVVSRGGHPLAGAQVVFDPLDVDASSATAITDKNGEFTLQYVEGVRGAVVGKNRVYVSLLDDHGREVIKAKTPYGLGSNEIWIVEPGSQEFQIDTDVPHPAPSGAGK